MGDKGLSGEGAEGWGAGGAWLSEKRPRSSCSCSRNLRRVFSQTQMWEKNRGPRLAEMTRLQMKGRLRALTLSKFSPKRMEND